MASKGWLALKPLCFAHLHIVIQDLQFKEWTLNQYGDATKGHSDLHGTSSMQGQTLYPNE